VIRSAVPAIVAGAASGAILLGGGGRLAMFLFAVATGRPPGFTLGGSLNVVFAGAIVGVVGGLLLALIRRWLPGRPWVRGVSFGALCYLVAIPGFRPPTPLVFGLFAPLFVAFGVVTVWAHQRLSRPPRSNEEL
jgi:hypothetical protein